MTAHQESAHPLEHIDLSNEVRSAEVASQDLHGFLAEGIDLLLDLGLPAALQMTADRRTDLDLQPSWGAVKGVAEIKSAMQVAR